MKNAFDRLNLRPSERRLVVGVGAVVFIVLNMVFVWPHFSDRTKALEDLDAAKTLLGKFEKEIAQKSEWDKKIKEVESAADPVPEEDQGTEFELTITRQASQSGVQQVGSSRLTTRTNQFFLERTKTVTILSEERQLVDFLYNLGAGGSLTRVRGLSLRTDAPRQRLSGNVTIVASYQKKAPPKPAAAAVTSKAPAAKTTKPEKAVTPTSVKTQTPPAKVEQPAPGAGPAGRKLPPNRPVGPPVAGKSVGTMPPPGTPPSTNQPPRK